MSCYTSTKRIVYTINVVEIISNEMEEEKTKRLKSPSNKSNPVQFSKNYKPLYVSTIANPLKDRVSITKINQLKK
jgi:hypothetical protein